MTGSGRGAGGAALGLVVGAAAVIAVPPDVGAGALEVVVVEPVMVRVAVEVFDEVEVGGGDSAIMTFGALTPSMVANPSPVCVAIIVRVPSPVLDPPEGVGPDGDAELTRTARSPIASAWSKFLGGRGGAAPGWTTKSPIRV